MKDICDIRRLRAPESLSKAQTSRPFDCFVHSDLQSPFENIQESSSLPLALSVVSACSNQMAALVHVKPTRPPHRFRSLVRQSKTRLRTIRLYIFTSCKRGRQHLCQRRTCNTSMIHPEKDKQYIMGKNTGIRFDPLTLKSFNRLLNNASYLPST
jgi:hypothetical protein